jgi:hypothetical protein
LAASHPTWRDSYPTVQVCDECVAANAKSGRDTGIVAEMPYGPSHGDECHFCGKTRGEEKEEELGR